MPRYSDADLPEEIRRVADVADADGAPSLQDFRDHSDIADTTVLRRFDSWNAAVAKAGFEPNDPQQRIPTEGLLDELQRLGDEVGRAPHDRGNERPRRVLVVDVQESLRLLGRGARYRLRSHRR